MPMDPHTVRRLGYHHLQMADGTMHHMVVCEVDAQDRVLGWHHLQGEEAHTEWVGGTRIINE